MRPPFLFGKDQKRLPLSTPDRPRAYLNPSLKGGRTQMDMRHPPSSLKIGAHEVRLVFTDHWPGDDGNYGEWVSKENTIYIRSGLSESLVFSTLIHEAMHVMNATLGHELLDSLSEQMAQFLLDNGFISET